MGITCILRRAEIDIKERIKAKVEKLQEQKIQEAKNERRHELIKNQKVVRTYNL